MKRLGRLRYRENGAYIFSDGPGHTTQIVPGVYWGETEEYAGLFVELETALSTLSPYAWGIGIIWDDFLVFDREDGAVAAAFAEHPEWARDLGAKGSLENILSRNMKLRDDIYHPENDFPERGEAQIDWYRGFRELKVGDVIVLTVDEEPYYSGPYRLLSKDPLQAAALSDGEKVQFQSQQFEGYYDRDRLIQF